MILIGFLFILWIYAQEPSDIILAAFAQVQSLTGILNEHIKLPQIEPNEMLVKSASLCDDCFKTAEKHLHEHRQQMKAKMQQQQQQQKHSTSLICQSSSTPTTVINNNSSSDSLIESINNSVPDDDGYCQIDEIRLPAIIKPAPPIPPNIVSDPRRQSAPAPLPPPSDDDDDDDVNDNSQTQSTTPDNSNSDATPTTESNTNESNISTNKSNDEYIEVNSAYDSIGQPLAKLDLNDERNSGKTCCDNPIYGNETNADFKEYSIPTIPCHLISSYISGLNLHISQLLVNFDLFFLYFNCLDLLDAIKSNRFLIIYLNVTAKTERT